jgi:hypothetical protein
MRPKRLQSQRGHAARPPEKACGHTGEMRQRDGGCSLLDRPPPLASSRPAGHLGELLEGI